MILLRVAISEVHSLKSGHRCSLLVRVEYSALFDQIRLDKRKLKACNKYCQMPDNIKSAETPCLTELSRAGLYNNIHSKVMIIFLQNLLIFSSRIRYLLN